MVSFYSAFCGITLSVINYFFNSLEINKTLRFWVSYMSPNQTCRESIKSYKLFHVYFNFLHFYLYLFHDLFWYFIIIILICFLILNYYLQVEGMRMTMKRMAQIQTALQSHISWSLHQRDPVLQMVRSDEPYVTEQINIDYFSCKSVHI